MSKYIVVGQGIAGSILAYTLIKQGHTVTIIDKGSGSSSSRVAAGIFHPLVFKRTTLTWKAAELFDFLEHYYPRLENELEAKFYYKLPYYRLFSTPTERENWIKYRELPEFKTFLGADSDVLANKPFTLTYGVGEVLRSGWVDINTMLDLFRTYFTNNANVVDELFDYNLIEFIGNEVRYKSIVADKLIFAEGYGITKNPYFNYLPLNATKGQVLTIESTNLPTDGIYNRKVFVLPLTSYLSSPNTFKVGSNYEWKWDTALPTEDIKADLIANFMSLTREDFEVKLHQAGIRPSVLDRRPLIGLHPQYNQLAVFNGMGSKGIMMAPYFANEFVGFLAGKNDIDKESNIERFEN